MKSLWTSWSSVQRQARRSERLLLVLDYDGTLTPIRDHPADAYLPVRVTQLIERLARHPRLRVALISGRSLRDLKRRVRVAGVFYAGNHGLELEGPGVAFTHPTARRCQPVLRRIARRVRQVLRNLPGAWLEWKGLTFSAHCREAAPDVRRRFYRVLTERLSPLRAGGLIRLTRGKCVLEVHPPVRWDKGQAVRWLWRHHRVASPVIYLGDDRTDEDAFRMVNRLAGLSIFVGPPGHATAARWRVANPRVVATVLTRLLETYG